MVQNSIIAKSDVNYPAANDTGDNYAIIEIDNRNYAISTNKILEVIKLVELDYPSGMMSCVLGVLHFKQEPVSVLDLRDIFKKERITYGLNTKIIVIQADDTRTAIACDRVVDIKKLDKSKIFPVNYQESAEFFEGLYSDNAEDIYIISIQKIIDFIFANVKAFSNPSSKQYIVSDEESKKILNSRKKSLIELDNAVPSSISLYDSGITFLINNAKYYINMASVREFYKVNKSKFIKVPCTKDCIFGLINIKGEYITVIDIRNLYYGLKTTIKEKSTIIILNSEEFKIGILADEICESMAVDFDEIIQNRLQKSDENKLSEFVKDDEIYQVLNMEQLLKDERLSVM